jgi:hypothetical protein
MRWSALPLVVALTVQLAACSDESARVLAPPGPNWSAAKAAADMAFDSTWVILWKPGAVADGPRAAADLVARRDGQLRQVFAANLGFSAKLPPQAIEGLRRNPAIRVITPNQWIRFHHHSVQDPAPWRLT